MRTLTVKRLGVVSVANFAAMLAGIVALVNVVLGWVLAMINYTQLNTYFPGLADWNTGYGLLAVVIVPLVAAGLGWLGGAVIAWFYNLALGATRGVQFDVEE